MRQTDADGSMARSLILVGAEQQYPRHHSREQHVANAEPDRVGLRSLIDAPRMNGHRDHPCQRNDGKAGACQHEDVPDEREQAQCAVCAGHRVDGALIEGFIVGLNIDIGRCDLWLLRLCVCLLRLR